MEQSVCILSCINRKFLDDPTINFFLGRRPFSRLRRGTQEEREVTRWEMENGLLRGISPFAHSASFPLPSPPPFLLDLPGRGASDSVMRREEKRREDRS